MKKNNSLLYWQIFIAVVAVWSGFMFFSFRSFNAEMDHLMYSAGVVFSSGITADQILENE